MFKRGIPITAFEVDDISPPGFKRLKARRHVHRRADRGGPVTIAVCADTCGAGLIPQLYQPLTSLAPEIRPCSAGLLGRRTRAETRLRRVV